MNRQVYMQNIGYPVQVCIYTDPINVHKEAFDKLRNEFYI